MLLHHNFEVLPFFSVAPAIGIKKKNVARALVGLVLSNECLSARGFEKYVERVDTTLLKMGNIHPGDRYRAIGWTGAPF